MQLIIHNLKGLNGVHVQTSALSGIGVDYLFEQVIEKLLEQKKLNVHAEISEVKDNGIFLANKEMLSNSNSVNAKAKKKGCC